MGRSLAYRFGAMQGLAQVALMEKLPAGIKPAQVRSALTLVIKRMITPKGTFDKDGWLQIGFAGHQPHIGEKYISTGSLYMCTAGMLCLGLPADNAFWKDPSADWSSKKLYNGEDFINNMK